MQIKSLAASLCVLVLGGCAQAPSFRNVVYDKVSSTAQVLSPYGNPKWKTNAYRLSPGMVLNATTSEPASVLTKSAGLLGGVEGCYQTIFTLKKAQRVVPLINPVHAPYDIKILLASPFTKQAALDSFRNKPGLEDIPENALAYIRQVDYDITNIKAFEATPGQIGQAIKQIRADKDCTIKTDLLTSQVVRRIYIGDIKIAVRWDKGYSVALGPLANRIQNSLRYNIDAPKVIFAVETDRTGLF